MQGRADRYSKLALRNGNALTGGLVDGVSLFQDAAKTGDWSKFQEWSGGFLVNALAAWALAKAGAGVPGESSAAGVASPEAAVGGTAARAGRVVVKPFESFSAEERLLIEIGVGAPDTNGVRTVATVGRPQVTGTSGHPETSASFARGWARSGRYYLVAQDESLNRWTGQSLYPDVKADVMGLRWDGRVDLLEVRSKSQTPQFLQNKLEATRNKLPEKMRGDIRVVEPGELYDGR